MTGREYRWRRLLAEIEAREQKKKERREAAEMYLSVAVLFAFMFLLCGMYGG